MEFVNKLFIEFDFIKIHLKFNFVSPYIFHLKNDKNERIITKS